MLDIIHEGKKAKNLVVFIHGLQGNQDTWVNKETNFNMPSTLAAESELKDKFSFALFNYYSSVVTSSMLVKHGKSLLGNFISGKQRKVQLNLDVKSIANMFYTYLQAYAGRYESIVLIGHSMGGLVAKSLIIGHKGTEIVKKIQLVVSLAVPHNGSTLATLGNLLLSNAQLNNLEPLNIEISKLTQDWLDNKDCNPGIIYFQGMYDKIVPEASAVAFDVNPKDIRYCDDDHISISKPASSQHLIYVSIKNALLNIDKNQEADEVLESTIDEDIEALEDELFVAKLVVANVHERLIKNAKQRFFDAERAKKSATLVGAPKKAIDELYTKIEQIYINEFGRVLSGEIEGGTALVIAVHDRIRQEDSLTLKSLERLNFTHKTGMIHQLANKVETDIWWAKEQGISSVEEFTQRKSGL